MPTKCHCFDREDAIRAECERKAIWSVLYRPCANLIAPIRGPPQSTFNNLKVSFYLIGRPGGTRRRHQIGERRILAGSIGPGGVVGWSCLSPPYEWQFTASTLGETSAMFFYATVLREYCDGDPPLGFELLKRMAAEVGEAASTRAHALARILFGVFTHR